MARPLEFTHVSGKLLPATPSAREFMGKLEHMEAVYFRIVDRNVGSKSMLATWRMWMDEIAAHMRHKGCYMPLYYDSKGEPHGKRPFTADDAHQLYTMTFLGCDSSGRRYSWGMSADQDSTPASMGARLDAMNQCVDFCLERGIPITIPEGKYRDAAKKQHEVPTEKDSAYEDIASRK